MRAIPTIVIAVLTLAIGFLAGRLTANMGSGSAAAAKKGPVKPAAPPPMAPPTVGGFQFEGMEFDLTPTFRHPQVTFPEPVKLYFRIRLKDMRVPAHNGKKPKANVTYRRLGKTEKQNGPMRTLSDADLKPTGNGSEVIAFKPGLTFMSDPPEGTTSFEVFGDGQPMGRAKFTIGSGTPPPAAPSAKPQPKPTH